jgi:hypothetical protein
MKVKRMWKEGAVAQLKVPSPHLPGENEENHKISDRIPGLQAKI